MPVSMSVSAGPRARAPERRAGRPRRAALPPAHLAQRAGFAPKGRAAVGARPASNAVPLPARGDLGCEERCHAFATSQLRVAAVPSTIRCFHARLGACGSCGGGWLHAGGGGIPLSAQRPHSHILPRGCGFISDKKHFLSFSHSAPTGSSPVTWQAGCTGSQPGSWRRRRSSRPRSCRRSRPSAAARGGGGLMLCVNGWAALSQDLQVPLAGARPGFHRRRLGSTTRSLGGGGRGTAAMVRAPGLCP
jgi:hypothetical protein